MAADGRPRGGATSRRTPPKRGLRQSAAPRDFVLGAEMERLGNGEVVTTIRMPWAPGDRFYHAKDGTWWAAVSDGGA